MRSGASPGASAALGRTESPAAAVGGALSCRGKLESPGLCSRSCEEGSAGVQPDWEEGFGGAGAACHQCVVWAALIPFWGLVDLGSRYPP